MSKEREALQKILELTDSTHMTGVINQIDDVAREALEQSEPRMFNKVQVFVKSDNGELLEMNAYVLNDSHIRQIKQEIAKDVWVEMQKTLFSNSENFIKNKYKI